MCSRQRQTDGKKNGRWRVTALKVFSITQIGARWPGPFQARLKESDKHIVMLNDDMMSTGGTGSRDITVSGQKHIHKGARQ